MIDLEIEISDGLEKRFRKIAMIKYGHKKDPLSIAAEEAFKEWMLRTETKK